MTSRDFFYPSTYYAAWASDFWEVLDALEEDGRIRNREMSRDTVALVAALLVVANKVDDLRDLGR